MKTILTTLVIASTLVGAELRQTLRLPYQTKSAKVKSDTLTKEQSIIARTILGEARGEGVIR